ncbi:hypothetical protein KVR01_004348 [Diaporthe batatas]|uniref:uncharacterized protein n=1 Tax=Diaporthe batatas TaxID=748121 RepID=UPI001D0563F3|nr:uncharacterized protein KVR01_004348 [Diaporthe batatas]KAG8165796.1 hypothetical protein KVR01_004348 [Diaporthe batatas]
MLRLPTAKLYAAFVYVCIAFTLIITLRSLWFGQVRQSPLPQDLLVPTEPVEGNLAFEIPLLPADYNPVHEQPSMCQKRLGLLYLEELQHSRAAYCSDNSTSHLTCFHSRTDKSGRVDSFCIGQGAKLDDAQKKFGLSCHPAQGRSIETNEASVRLEDFSRYWYETGPRTVMDHFVDLDIEEGEIPLGDTQEPESFAILLKREGPHNLWHSLMEIMALSTTLDVLQMSPNDADPGKPFLTPQDAEHTQVVILDDAVDGPYFDLWRLFAKKPTLRLSEVPPGSRMSKIIIPLPGGANPVWQGDWEPNICEHSDILRVFAHRVLTHLGIRDIEEAATDDSKIIVTFIDRQGTRKLIDIERHMLALGSRFPHADIRRVDLAAIPFAQQVQLVRDSDVLAGTHGAGLTHGLWMKEGSAMVEILPEDFMHKGFRNLAGALGHNYFSAHGTQPDQGSGSWQEDDVVLEDEKLFELMDVAIKSMYNKGRHNYDVL